VLVEFAAHVLGAVVRRPEPVLIAGDLLGQRPDHHAGDGATRQGLAKAHLAGERAGAGTAAAWLREGHHLGWRRRYSVPGDLVLQVPRSSR